MRSALAVLISVLLLLGWCERDPLVPEIPDFQIPGKVELRPGQSVRLRDLGTVLTFKKVTQDSRCAIGAMCVWAGDAAVWLSIRGTESRDCTLHTTLDPKFVNFRTMTVRLDTVAPYPYMGDRIDSLDYRVTLELLEPPDPTKR